jgi:hypothetical protein
MRNHKRLLGPAVTAAAIAALVLFVVFGNTDTAIMAAGAAALAGMYLLRRYARDRLVYDNDSQPDSEVSVPASGSKSELVDEGTIADLAERMRGRF